MCLYSHVRDRSALLDGVQELAFGELADRIALATAGRSGRDALTRLLGATVNGFLALERAGSFGHRDPAPEVSWRRALDALDSVFRAWPAS